MWKSRRWGDQRMNDIHNELKRMLEKHPNCLKSRNQIQSLLQDYFYNDKLEVRLLVMAYEDGVVAKAQQSNVLDDAMAYHLGNGLVSNYGIAEENALWAIRMWFLAFDKKVNVSKRNILSPLQTSSKISVIGSFFKKLFSRVNNPLSASLESDSIDSKSNQQPSDEVQSEEKNLATVIQSVKGKTKRASKKQNPLISAVRLGGSAQAQRDRKLKMLQSIFDANFFGDSKKYKWQFLERGHGNTQYFIYNERNEQLGRSIPDDVKALSLTMICHGQYEEDDLIHIAIDSRLTHGWAFTYDSFCTGGIMGKNIIKYADIQYVGVVGCHGSDLYIITQNGCQISFDSNAMDSNILYDNYEMMAFLMTAKSISRIREIRYT